MFEKKSKLQPWGALLVILLLVAASVFYIQRQMSDATQQTRQLELGAGQSPLADSTPHPAPQALWEVGFPDLAGKQQQLSQWRGKVLVVNFWASWCPPCRAEIPDFIRAQKEYGSRGLQFVGIAVDHPEAVTAFAKEFGINYPVLQAETGGMELAESLGNVQQALPYTLIIDRKGHVVETVMGMLSPDQFDQLMKPLLGS